MLSLMLSSFSCSIALRLGAVVFAFMSPRDQTSDRQAATSNVLSSELSMCLCTRPVNHPYRCLHRGLSYVLTTGASKSVMMSGAAVCTSSTIMMMKC